MRPVVASAVVALALMLTGCGSKSPSDADGNADDTTPSASAAPTTEASPTPSESPTAAAAADGVAAMPCDLVDPADVEAAYGVPVGEGSDGGGSSVGDGGVKYTSQTCQWESDDVIEVALAVSRAADFGGTLQCPELDYLGTPGEPVSGLPAKSAAWLASEDPNEIEARMRVCTGAEMIDIEIDATSGSSTAELRDQTIAFAKAVLAAL